MTGKRRRSHDADPLTEFRSRDVAERLLNHALGRRNRVVPVTFFEAGRRLECSVPDDALWSGVLFVLLLRAYERAGLYLADVEGAVVDAGAHVGLFALQASAHGNQVLAIEPHPANFALLVANVHASGATNVRTLNRALWGRSDDVEVFDGRDSVSAAIGSGSGSAARVASVTLAEVVAELGSIGLVKMNIEGAEFGVLDQAPDETLKRVRRFAIELHSRERPDVEPLVGRLRSLGFSVTVERPLFYGWREPCRRIVANWRRVPHLNRLKFTALAAFSAATLVRPVANVAAAMDTDGLRYLFAFRG